METQLQNRRLEIILLRAEFAESRKRKSSECHHRKEKLIICKQLIRGNPTNHA